jgi:histo-blood group ABO system transferase
VIEKCKKIVFILFLLVYSSVLYSDNIGLLIMATGKYIHFVPPLIDSARTHFCKNHTVTFFVFTDGTLPPANDIVCIPQSRLGWPYDTMMRFETYATHKDILLSQDYLFASDADMLFVNEVGDEILGRHVATQHPGFVNQRGSYETNPSSNAYVAPTEGQYYFAGGFYGGAAAEVIKIAETCSEKINADLHKGLIAVWHDESHWNRYCIDHKPTIILSPSYCYPESWNLPYIKRLLCLDKNHKEYQTSP